MIPSKILIVDDDKDDQDFLTTAIHDVVPGCKTVTVSDGFEAMDFLIKKATRKPDVIVADINMPRCDGICFAKLLKENTTFKTIPLFVLTTSANPDDYKKFDGLGVNAIYKKPIEFKSWRTIVKWILDKS